MRYARHILAAATAGALFMSGHLQAAIISEVGLAERTVTTPAADVYTLTPMIELSELTPGAMYDLVIVDAASSPELGKVLQVLPFTAGGATVLVAESDWPAAYWPGTSPPADLLHTVSRLNVGFLDSHRRDLLLFAGGTGLLPGQAVAGPAPVDITGLTLLDSLAYTRGPAAEAALGGPLVDIAQAAAIARPRSPLTFAIDPAHNVFGTPDIHSRLLEYDPPFPLNPGLDNVFWQGQRIAPMPEPASALLLAFAAAGWLTRRRRR